MAQDPRSPTGDPARQDPAPEAADPRRRIPRTDTLLALPQVAAAIASLGESVVKGLVRATQDRARTGTIAAEAVETELLAALGTQRTSSLTPVLNATGVLVHTNLGRAPLSEAARAALADAAGYTDLEFDLVSGARSRRGAGARAALLAACPAAEDALVVNNGAAALMLATTAYAQDASVLISRGEFVEIGAGFRLSDLIESTGVILTEVGTTNRTHLADYSREFERSDASAEAGGVTYLRAVASPPIGAVLKVHRSNFRIDGFTAEPAIADLAALCHERDVPLIVDLGSGLLEPEPRLTEEPDAATALASGADVVIASGDKLLGGPQAGILLGRADVIALLSRHPMARAVRADKLTLAALEATLTAGDPPVHEALHLDPDALRLRTERLAAAVDGQMAARMERMQSGTGAPERAVEGATADTDQPQPRPSLVAAAVVPHAGRVGGGGGTGVDLPGWALALPEAAAAPLRTGTPAIVGRVHEGRCLLDLRCVPEEADGDIAVAVVDVLIGLTAGSADESTAAPTPEPDRTGQPDRSGRTSQSGRDADPATASAAVDQEPDPR